MAVPVSLVPFRIFALLLPKAKPTCQIKLSPSSHFFFRLLLVRQIKYATRTSLQCKHALEGGGVHPPSGTFCLELIS